MKSKTFFLSEDINLILNGNSLFKDFYKQKGIIVPSKSKLNSIRQRMLDNLEITFNNVETIPEEQLLQEMQFLASKSSYPLVSLDEIYLKDNPNVKDNLNITRIKIGGKTFMSTRSSDGLYLPYEKEISRVCDSLKKQYPGDSPHPNFAY